MNVYIITSIVLVSIFLVLGIILHSIHIKRLNKDGSFIVVEIIFILLIILGMLIIREVADYYEKTVSVDSDSQQNSQEVSSEDKDDSVLINSLVEMQANTLSVTAIIITISSIIISALTIYRERKTEINSEKVDQSIKMLDNTNKMIQELAAISSIMLLNNKQQEVFISIIKQEVEKLGKTSEYSNVAYSHFHMILMDMTLFNQYYMIGKEHGYSEYDEIIQNAKKIIENEESTQLSINFAYIERVHAAYQKLKNSTEDMNTEEKMKRVQKNISDAHEYLKDLKKLHIEDFNGHIANLTGLIELWTGIAKIRMYENNDNRAYKEESENHYNEARKCFEYALTKNPYKIEFKNHMIVTLLRLSDVAKNENDKNIYLDKAKKICEEINDKHPSYIKSRINLADTIARQIRLRFKIEPSYDSEIKHVIFNYIIIENNTIETSREETKKALEEAKKALEEAKDIDEGFPNSYYKMVEICILELCVTLTDGCQAKTIEQIEKNLKEARDKAEKNKIDIYEYSYLCLMEKYYKNINKRNKLKKELNEIQKRKSNLISQIQNNIEDDN